MTIKDIYEAISFSFEKSLDQSKTFTKSHVRYDIYFTRPYSKTTIKTVYQCNPKFTKITKDDVFYCLLSDAECYANCCDDLDYFAESLGIEKVTEAIKSFNVCKEIYNNLIDFLGSEEIYKQMVAAFENY